MRRAAPIADPPLSRKEAAAFDALAQKEKAALDDAILSCVLPQCRKVAMIVMQAAEKLGRDYPQFSYVFYAHRLRVLAKQGRIESQGDLRNWRFSELRLPAFTS
jgi:hypothetical protein